MAINNKNMKTKRIFDIIVSFIILIIFSPLFLLAAALIKITSPGEVIFKQKRLGQHGKVFYMQKFRSMIKNAENIGSGMFIEENDRRITWIGKILRKTSLDELPQLINVLKGEMSIVGPRPAPVFHLEKYTEEQKRRLLVKPGITGWAQVNGRVAIYWPERIKMDLWYIDNYSFKLDLNIIIKTVLAVFSKKSSTPDPDRKIKDPFMNISREENNDLN